MSVASYEDFRPSVEADYAARGIKLSDAEWDALCATVDKAPPMTDERLSLITSLMVPVAPSLIAPSVDSPSTRGGGKAQARRRRSSRPDRAA